jgi:hypothetical protein
MDSDGDPGILHSREFHHGLFPVEPAGKLHRFLSDDYIVVRDDKKHDLRVIADITAL